MKRLAPLALTAALLMPTPSYAAHQSDCQKAVDPDRRCTKISVLGHRAQAGANENTLLALAHDGAAGVGFETDAWVLRDGTAVIFHDEYLARVVDPSSMPPGVTGRTAIYDLTLNQFRQLRTYGGQPLPTMKEWIRYAGTHGIPGIIERKRRPGAPVIEAAQTTAYVEHWHAEVSVYEVPKCDADGVVNTDMDDFGLEVGVKYLGGCQPTPEQMADAGYRYVITSIDAMTRAYVVSVHHYGMKIGNFDSGQVSTWTAMAQVGADMILAPHPARAERWLTP